MRNIKIFFTTNSIFLAFTLLGQNRTYIGMELALTNDKYTISDEGDRIHPGHSISGSGGFTLRQDLNRYLSLETGLIFKLYQSGFGINGHPDFYNSKDAINCWQIPIRINGRLNLKNNVLFLRSMMGYHFCFNNSYYSSSGSAGITFFNNIPVFSYDENSNYTLTKTYPLLEGGIGLEVVLSGKSILTFSMSDYSGFKKIIESDITYQVADGPTSNAEMYSTGDYISYCVGFSYPISSVWQNKKKVIYY